MKLQSFHSTGTLWRHIAVIRRNHYGVNGIHFYAVTICSNGFKGSTELYSSTRLQELKRIYKFIYTNRYSL